MVIRGNTRGNGEQLGRYLLTLDENENIRIMDVAGRRYAQDDYLHQTIYSMELNSELTNSVKGLYHAQINPSTEESQHMQDEDWFTATDILAKELGLENQRRIIVLHEKKGRTHAHVVFERYDYETGKIKSDSFSRLAQDRARMKMEQVFSHEPTPRRNKHRPELKEAMTTAWQETDNAKAFMQAVEKAGYMVAQGSLRNPFTVVDGNGRTFDLVRQLKGTRIKEVRERMKGQELIHEKEAIELMRAKNKGNAGKTGKDEQEQKAKLKPTLSKFSETKQDTTKQETTHQEFWQKMSERVKERAKQMGKNSDDLTAKPEPQQQEVLGQEKKNKIASEFAENKKEEQQPELTEKEKTNTGIYQGTGRNPRAK